MLRVVMGTELRTKESDFCGRIRCNKRKQRVHANGIKELIMESELFFSPAARNRISDIENSMMHILVLDLSYRYSEIS